MAQIDREDNGRQEIKMSIWKRSSIPPFSFLDDELMPMAKRSAPIPLLDLKIISNSVHYKLVLLKLLELTMTDPPIDPPIDLLNIHRTNLFYHYSPLKSKSFSSMLLPGNRTHSSRQFNTSWKVQNTINRFPTTIT